MSMPRLWAFLAVGLPVLGALIAGLSSVDLTYHLRAGNEILDARAIPSTDSWTFTAMGVAWFDQQWGAQVLFAVTERIGGWTGLVLLRTVLVGVTFGVLFLTARRRGLDDRTAALLTLAAFGVAAVALGLRPQLFGMALFAIVLYLVADRRANPTRLWLIPLIVVVWANVHGSFFLAPLVLGLAWLEDVHDHAPTQRQTLLMGLLTGLAACITPFGPLVWLYAIGLSTNPEVTSQVREWQPTSLRDISGVLFFGSALAVAALLARRGRATPWPSLAWLAVFFLIGTYAVRGVAWWPLAVVPVVAAMLAMDATEHVRPERALSPTGRRLNVVLAGLVVIASVALLPVWRPLDPGLGTPTGVVTQAPSGITGALRDLLRPGDRLFNPQPWGSWFEYAFPQTLVALDSRVEMFPADVWRTHARVAAGVDGWDDQLEAWGVTMIVAVGDEGDAFTARLLDAGWQVAYEDVDGRVIVRGDR